MEEELPFGERLDRWLTFVEMRQSSFARALQVKPPTVNAWVAGREAPRSDRLPAIAAALKMTLSEFFGPLPPKGMTMAQHTAAAAAAAHAREEELPPHPRTGDITREIRFDVEKCPCCGNATAGGL